MQNSVNGISSLLNNTSTNKTSTNDTKDFSKVLEGSISEVNGLQENAQKAMSDMATGEVKDLHQAAIAIDKAELSMKMMLEVRNKALNAYKEIIRTQI